MTRLIDGRYELRRLLNRTPAARVHLAFDTQRERDVVLRLFPHARDPEQRAALRGELERRQGVHSASLVPCEAVGESDGILYTVEPMIEGVSAEERHTTQGPFPISDAVTVGIRVLEALEALHASGVVHGSVSTSTACGLAPDGPVRPEGAMLASAVSGVAADATAAGSMTEDVRAAARVVLDLSGEPDDDRSVEARLQDLRQRDAGLLAGFLAGPLDPQAPLPGGARALRTSLALFAQLDEGGRPAASPREPPAGGAAVGAPAGVASPPVGRDEPRVRAPGLAIFAALGSLVGIGFVWSVLGELSPIIPGVALLLLVAVAVFHVARQAVAAVPSEGLHRRRRLAASLGRRSRRRRDRSVTAPEDEWLISDDETPAAEGPAAHELTITDVTNGADTAAQVDAAAPVNEEGPRDEGRAGSHRGNASR